MSMTDHSPKIEVITSVQRRRRWSAAEKMRMVEETYQPDASVSLVARRHGVGPNQLFTWRRLAAQGALTAAAAGEEVVPASDHRALQQQIRELRRRRTGSFGGNRTQQDDLASRCLRSVHEQGVSLQGRWRRRGRAKNAFQNRPLNARRQMSEHASDVNA